MPAIDIPEFEAKSAVRILLSYASEGAQAVDLFAAEGGPCCQYVSPAFFSAVDADPSSYPSGLGGLTMSADRSRRGREAAVAGHCTVCSDLVPAGIDWRER